MTVALLVITDGRDEYLAECINSAEANLRGPLVEWWMYDDTGDDSHRRSLKARYPEFAHINAGPRQGFAGAIAHAWSTLAVQSRADWIVHLEQDFTYARAVDLEAIAVVLEEQPHLVQMALRRQAWSSAEHAAGGVIEQHPDAYRERVDVVGRRWLEHRLFFTTNPSMYRRTLCARGWPVVPRSEGMFTHQLLQTGTQETPGDRVAFGYWGARDDPPWVEHIGHNRAGVGY